MFLHRQSSGVANRVMHKGKWNERCRAASIQEHAAKRSLSRICTLNSMATA